VAFGSIKFVSMHSRSMHSRSMHSRSMLSRSTCDATHRVRSEFREKHATILTFIGACGQSKRDA
jgi:hypothetical protein